MEPAAPIPDEPMRRWLKLAQGVGSDALMGVYFLATWFQPFAFDSRAPQGCMAIFFMEFVAIHSTAFLMYFARAKAGVIVAVLYVPVLAGVVWQFKVVWPIVFFAFHVYNTVAALWKPSGEDSVVQQVMRWLGSFGLFLGALLLAGFIPWPGFGWNETSVPDLAWSSNGRTVYHIVPAWGTFYFALLAWLGFRRWKREYQPQSSSQEALGRHDGSSAQEPVRWRRGGA